jgi:uncharacterized membrane protein
MLGIFFRFANIDRKVYWHDEAFTSLRISGYEKSEMVRQIFNGQVISLEELNKYQHPNSEKGLFGTIKGLATEEPQHPPLYYVIVRFWAQLFGSSVTVIRNLSALISLLVFPSIYWLSLELFESSLVGWIAILLVAVSPFHVLFAQEAREYVLWTVTILLSSTAFLRAMRLKTNLSWGIYAASLTLNLYTFLFSGLVAIGHGIYVLVTESFRLSKTVKAYLLASFVGFLAFTPWILIIIINLRAIKNTLSWTNKDSSWLFLAKTWCLNLSRVFLDVDKNAFFDVDLSLNNPITYLSLLIVILIGYSIYILCRETPKKVWLFVLTLIGSTALTLLLPDLILGGRRSVVSRYLFPCVLGIQLAVAYLLTTRITSVSINKQTQKLWQLLAITLFSIEVLSCTTTYGTEVTWNKTMSCYNPQVSHIINQANRPLLISNDDGNNPAYILSLSHLLEPKLHLQLVREPNIPIIPDGFSEIFLFNPSETLLHGLEKEQKYEIEPVYKPTCRGASGDSLWQIELWKLAKKNI